jgi:hypothetical protein
MEPILWNTITDETQLIVGAISFLLTALHVLTSFPLSLSQIIQNRFPKRYFLIGSFFIGVVTNVFWMIYVSRIGDLFLKIAIALWLVANLIFLIQAILFTSRKIDK